MQVIIVGAGRLGSALAHKSVANGHTTTVLVRSEQSKSIRPLPPQAGMTPIARANAKDCDLVLLAAPAWKDLRKEALIRTFLAGLNSRIPVCSSTAYEGSPGKEWAPENPFLQFMCSPAIANANHRAVVLTTLANPIAFRKFRAWLGKAELHALDRESYARLVPLYLATAIHCDNLARLVSALPPVLRKPSERFSSTTLREAHALLELHDFDAAKALDACLTPRGIARRAIDDFRRAATIRASDRRSTI